MDSLEIRRSIRACTKCPLHAQCGGPVPPTIPTSNPRDVLIIGEAPGRIEDRSVAPFQGPSGALVRRWLSEAQIDSSQVAWANVVCCWPRRSPPTPAPEEINSCRVNLLATLAYVKPRYVLLLGNVALNSFLPDKRIGEWRGMWWKDGRYYGQGTPGIKDWTAWFLSTYHPAAVLRNSSLTNLARADIEQFAFYSLGHFDPPAGEVEIKGKGKKIKRYWQQERLI